MSGARACIGRRFSETESVAVLTRIVARYAIQITEEPAYAGETFEQRKQRVLTYARGVTTTYATTITDEHLLIHEQACEGSADFQTESMISRKRRSRSQRWRMLDTPVNGLSYLDFGIDCGVSTATYLTR